MIPIIMQVRLTSLLKDTKFWLAILIFMGLLSVLAIKLKPADEPTVLPSIRKPVEEVLAKTIDLQSEINQASINGGGIVTVPKGMYVVDEPIILKSNVHLKGAGMGESILRLNLEKSKGSEDDSSILMTEPNAQNIRLVISHLMERKTSAEHKSMIHIHILLFFNLLIHSKSAE